MLIREASPAGRHIFKGSAQLQNVNKQKFRLSIFERFPTFRRKSYHTLRFEIHSFNSFPISCCHLLTEKIYILFLLRRSCLAEPERPNAFAPTQQTVSSAVNVNKRQKTSKVTRKSHRPTSESVFKKWFVF